MVPERWFFSLYLVLHEKLVPKLVFPERVTEAIMDPQGATPTPVRDLLSRGHTGLDLILRAPTCVLRNVVRPLKVR